MMVQSQKGSDGLPVIDLDVCYAGPIEEGEELLRPLRIFGPPLYDRVGPKSLTQVQAGAARPGLQNYVPALWHFMAGRGAHEKTYAELKQHFAFEAIPTNDLLANSAWQLVSVLTLNLMRSFQIAIGAPRRRRTMKRTFDYVFQSVQTLRFELIHQPLRVVRPAGRTELRFAVPTKARRRIQAVERRLQSTT